MCLWVTESCQALRIFITAITDDFVASADDVVCAVPLGATTTLLTIWVRGACLIAVEEVSTRISGAAARVALKIVITCIFNDFLAVKTFWRMYTWIVTAAISCIYTVIIEFAEDLFHNRDNHGCLRSWTTVILLLLRYSWLDLHI